MVDFEAVHEGEKERREQIAKLFYKTRETLDAVGRNPKVMGGLGAQLLAVLRAQNTMIQFLLAREGKADGRSE